MHGERRRVVGDEIIRGPVNGEDAAVALRDQGSISDEEFVLAKERVLQ